MEQTNKTRPEYRRPECHDPSYPSSLKASGVLLRQEPDEDDEDEDDDDDREEDTDNSTDDGYSE
jgi:hypothetical protein